MARTERQTGRQAEYACPACKQPVDTVIERHKTLGIFVPHWGPGPCHNADCHRYSAEDGAGGTSGKARGSHTVRR
ncbi:hypothetical protein ACFYY2_15680 [Streptomyces sp. NPDC001822]|uniref:hypothetical protein n=1 Tax=Streptomyces sp. NPDC001822 TaxID=3364614 RepID=UPI0036B2E939